MLVIDADAQCNASRWLLGESPAEYDPGPTLLHWATGQPDTDGLVRPTPLGPDLVPAHPRMNAHLEGKPPVYIKDLTSALSHYDFCLIDTPPFIGSSVWAALSASRHVIVPIQLEGLAIEGLQGFEDALSAARERFETEVEILGLFANQVDVRRKETEQGWAFLEGAYPNLVFETRLRQRASVARAATAKESLLGHDDDGHVTEALTSLTSEIKARIDHE